MSLPLSSSVDCLSGVDREDREEEEQDNETLNPGNDDDERMPSVVFALKDGDAFLFGVVLDSHKTSFHVRSLLGRRFGNESTTNNNCLD